MTTNVKLLFQQNSVTIMVFMYQMINVCVCVCARALYAGKSVIGTITPSAVSVSTSAKET